MMVAGCYPTIGYLSMRPLQLSKSVEQVILLERDSSGQPTPVVLYTRRGKKKKKTTWGLRTLDKFVSQGIAAQQAFVDKLRDETKKSRRRTKNGWLIDLGNNVFKAVSSGGKKIRPDGLI
jgi:hypothetical protein